MDAAEQNRYIDQLQKIHALRDEIGLDSQHYRNILHSLTGSYTARYMTPEQREACIVFLDAMKAIQQAEKALEATMKALDIALNALKSPQIVRPKVEK